MRWIFFCCWGKQQLQHTRVKICITTLWFIEVTCQRCFFNNFKWFQWNHVLYCEFPYSRNDDFASFSNCQLGFFACRGHPVVCLYKYALVSFPIPFSPNCLSSCTCSITSYYDLQQAQFPRGEFLTYRRRELKCWSVF